MSDEPVKESICDRCGKAVSLVYELRGLRLCEDCYMDELASDQPKQCRMKRR